MSFTKKLGMLFFLIGMGIVLFSGLLESGTESNTQFYKFVTLAVCGIFTAFFNVREDENKDLILAGGIFLISVFIFTGNLKNFTQLSQIFIILTNMAFFVASILVTLTFIAVITIASQKDSTTFVDLAREDTRRFSIWDAVMIVAVVAVIVILVMELFFNITNYQKIIQYIDYIIVVIFFIDLIILYRKALGWKDFFKHNWLDIVAVIPLSNIFRAVKIVRFIKIIKFLNKTGHASKLVKANMGLKFFSKRSGFNKYLGTHQESAKTKTKKTKSKTAKTKTKTNSRKKKGSSKKKR